MQCAGNVWQYCNVFCHVLVPCKSAYSYQRRHHSLFLLSLFATLDAGDVNVEFFSNPDVEFENTV